MLVELWVSLFYAKCLKSIILTPHKAYPQNILTMWKSRVSNSDPIWLPLLSVVSGQLRFGNLHSVPEIVFPGAPYGKQIYFWVKINLELQLSRLSSGSSESPLAFKRYQRGYCRSYFLFGFWPKPYSSTGDWCQVNQGYHHIMWIWLPHSQGIPGKLKVNFSIHLSVSPDSFRSHAQRRRIDILGYAPHIQHHA